MLRVASILLVLDLLVSSASPQPPRAGAQEALPPVSWTCPMHPDVVHDAAGSCPICKMALEPVRLDSAWSCPVHTAVAESRPGACPICKRDLVQITVSLVWTCPGSAAHELSPGRCPDGSARVATRERRPHGDHNPRHGGVFFMAADNWHHLEGAYPGAGVFRVYVYDDYTRPLALAAVTGRAVTKEMLDPALGKPREIDAYALRPSKDGAYLEARIPSARLPADIAAKIRFASTGEEYRFDFTFPAYSKEPRGGARPTLTNESPSQPPADTSGSSRTRPEPTQTTAEMLAELTTRSRQVDSLIQQGALTQVYVPAMVTKDLALALEARARDLPDERRARVASAVKRVVVAAWLLDLYGDLGNRQKLTEAYHAFAGAVGDLTAAYAETR
jgi:hypothetical protein